ncbi:hypothetical protein FIBSPDRAFT_420473 [Athelia psychrophila]|uniref:Uncharacterized protein n=1 Tax=Athelia psychrophila TaxID=1759441 RepID=A0A167UTK2_9AGAM|nr:hypothetical protein FIBSPDRAFT_420473 [Fibularhizoctonia sp. CBS 109695]
MWWRTICRQVYNKFLNTVGCPVAAGRRVYTKGELFKPRWWVLVLHEVKFRFTLSGALFYIKWSFIFLVV